MPRQKPPDGHALYALGALIAKQRMAAGLSQLDLANAVGTGRTTVMYWEMGYREPPLERLLRVAQACGKPISAFLAPLDAFRVAPLPADTPIRTFKRRRKPRGDAEDKDAPDRGRAHRARSARAPARATER